MEEGEITMFQIRIIHEGKLSGEVVIMPVL